MSLRGHEHSVKQGGQVGRLSGPVLLERVRWGGERGRLNLLHSRNAWSQKDGKGSLVVLLLAERAR
jgi:hypothetical protein